MLRGPQTPGELRQRAERLYAFGSSEELEAALEALAERELVRRLPRRPGQKEARYAQLLGGETASDEAPPRAPIAADPLEERVARLEAQVEELRVALDGLRQASP